MNGISYNVTKNRSSRLPESSICIACIERHETMSQVVLGCVLYGESKEFDLAATCDVWVWSRSMNVGVVCRVVIVRVWLHMHMGVLLHIVETSYVCMWGGGGGGGK